MIKNVQMGQLDIARAPDVLRTTLGSCVAIILFDPSTKMFGLAHAMLPDSKGDKKEPGKYVDSAIRFLIQKMGIIPAESKRLKAKLTGGAQMFPQMQKVDNLKIGERNIETAIDLLKKLGIDILGKDLGGNHGREVTVDTESSRVWIKTIGSPPKEL